MKESKVTRKEMLDRLGVVPLSILRLKRDYPRPIMHYAGETPEQKTNPTHDFHAYVGEGTTLRSKAKRAAVQTMHRTGTHSIYGIKPGLSIMPPELPRFFIRYWQVPPGGVYLDPFMGQGCQLQVAKHEGLSYWGYDASEEFTRYTQAVRDLIDDGKTDLRCFLGDSRAPDQIPDGIGDFGFTSPPYWDIEFYGDEKAQLGNNSYEEFLEGMEEVFRAWLPKFKPGGIFVVNVNDFRRGGGFYAYHSHCMERMERAGWEIHDLWILESMTTGLARCFAVQKNNNQHAPKVHEYCIIGRVPEKPRKPPARLNPSLKKGTEG